MKKYSYILFLVVFCFSCKDEVVPKPHAYLRLEYPEAVYKEALFNLPFTFEVNNLAGNVSYKKVTASTESYGVNIEYPTLKGTLFLTYKSIEGNEENLNAFLTDAQNFTQKHTVKADEIPVIPYENNERKVYGAFAEVKGDVASPAQFYVTDSVEHFLTGSLYFYAKPNYDSILPAAKYLQKDIRRIMETVKWK